MSIIAEGFNIGNMNLSSKYCLTKEEINNIGDGEGYPDVFPIWCTDEGSLYIFYRSTDGVAHIANLNDIPGSIEVPILYPILDPTTNILTWELRQATAEVPEPVELMGGKDGKDGEDGEPGANGESAYEVWLSLGNVGTEQDFIDSLKGEKGDPGDPVNIDSWTDAQVLALKERMGIPEMLDAIDNLQLLTSQLATRVTRLEEQISGGGEDTDEDPDDGGGGEDPSPTPPPIDPDNPPQEGDLYTDDDGIVWIFQGGEWVIKSDDPEPTPDDGGDDNPEEGGDDITPDPDTPEPTPDDGGDDNTEETNPEDTTPIDEGSGDDKTGEEPSNEESTEVEDNESGATGDPDTSLDDSDNTDETDDSLGSDDEHIVDAGDEG